MRTQAPTERPELFYILIRLRMPATVLLRYPAVSLPVMASSPADHGTLFAFAVSATGSAQARGRCHSLRSLNPPLAALPSLPPDCCDGMKILGLVGKIGNANTSSDRKAGAFSIYRIDYGCLQQSTGLLRRHDNTWPTWEDR